MATKRQKVQVGVFLVTAAALLAIVIVALTGVPRKSLDYYRVEFKESIAGLTEGSRVTYRGVSVGKVTDLRVTPENRVEVVVGIDPSKVTLREGVRARYTLLSVFGPYVVDLSGGTDPSAPLLAPGSYIEVQTSLLAGLEETFAETVPLALQRATKLIERLDLVFSKVKPEDIPNVIHRAEEVLASATKAVEDIRLRANELAATFDKAVRSAQAEIEATAAKAGASVEKFQQAANATAERANKLLETVQATIEENRKPLADALKRLDESLAKINQQLEGVELAATLKSVRGAADKLGKGAESVGDSVKGLTAARDDIRRSLANVERDLLRTLDSLDEALRSARDLLDTLERDPAALLRGRGREP